MGIAGKDRPVDFYAVNTCQTILTNEFHIFVWELCKMTFLAIDALFHLKGGYKHTSVIASSPQNPNLHPQSLTYNLKLILSKKMDFLFQGGHFQVQCWTSGGVYTTFRFFPVGSPKGLLFTVKEELAAFKINLTFIQPDHHCHMAFLQIVLAPIYLCQVPLVGSFLNFLQSEFLSSYSIPQAMSWKWCKHWKTRKHSPKRVLQQQLGLQNC